MGPLPYPKEVKYKASLYYPRPSNDEVGDSSPFLPATPPTEGKKGGGDTKQAKPSPSTSPPPPYPKNEEHSDSKYSNFTSSDMNTFSVRLKVT